MSVPGVSYPSILDKVPSGPNLIGGMTGPRPTLGNFPSSSIHGSATRDTGGRVMQDTNSTETINVKNRRDRRMDRAEDFGPYHLMFCEQPVGDNSGLANRTYRFKPLPALNRYLKDYRAFEELQTAEGILSKWKLSGASQTVVPVEADSRMKQSEAGAALTVSGRQRIFNVFLTAPNCHIRGDKAGIKCWLLLKKFRIGQGPETLMGKTDMKHEAAVAYAGALSSSSSSSSSSGTFFGSGTTAKSDTKDEKKTNPPPNPSVNPTAAALAGAVPSTSAAASSSPPSLMTVVGSGGGGGGGGGGQYSSHTPLKYTSKPSSALKYTAGIPLREYNEDELNVLAMTKNKYNVGQEEIDELRLQEIKKKAKGNKKKSAVIPEFYWQFVPWITDTSNEPPAKEYIDMGAIDLDACYVGAAIYVGQLHFVHNIASHHEAAVRQFLSPATTLDWLSLVSTMPQTDIFLFS